MAISDSGSMPKRVFLIQLAIVAGLIVFLKFYLPRKEKSDAAARLKERDARIESFFQTMAVEGSDGKSLRGAPSVEEVDQALGAPDTSTTDYAGGLHLTWRGARQSLECGFDHGSLYTLMLTDRSTGHGVMVFKPGTPSRTF